MLFQLLSVIRFSTPNVIELSFLVVHTFGVYRIDRYPLFEAACAALPLFVILLCVPYVVLIRHLTTYHIALAMRSYILHILCKHLVKKIPLCDF